MKSTLMIVPATHVTMASAKMALTAMTVFANLASPVRLNEITNLRLVNQLSLEMLLIFFF